MPLQDYMNLCNQAILGVRLVAFFFLILGVWLLLANIFESASSFNPAYLGYYIQSQLIRPLILIGIAILSLSLSRPLGIWLTRSLDK